MTPKRPLKPSGTRDALLVAGTLLASAFDLADELGRGTPLLTAGRKALRKGRRRVKGALELERQLATDDEER